MRTTFPCPAEADELVSPTCRFCQPGPFLGADDVRRVHGDFMDEVRARLRRLSD